MKVYQLILVCLVAMALDVHHIMSPDTKVESTNSVTPSEDGQAARFCECGLRDRLHSRIVGGERSEIQKYPWVVGITAFGNIYCGGALIDDRHILTAAHCFKIPEIIPHVGVSIGVTCRQEPSDNFQVEEIIVHNKYNKSRSGFNDIALIRLRNPVEISSRIRPICLPETVESYAGQFGIVAGWGVLKHDGEMSSNLQEVSVQIIDLEKCQTIFLQQKKRVDENNICAGGKEGKDACQGDSGSPLFLEVDGVFRIIGIVSWGIKCALDKIPGVYTNVAYYLPWIRSHINNSTCLTFHM